MSNKDEPRGESTALALRAPSLPSPSDDVQMQQLWLRLQQREWRSLAVVAASKGVSTLQVANALAKISWSFTGQPTCVFDLRDLSLRLVEHQIRDIAAQLHGGERVFVALRSIGENPTAVPIAMAADAAVLCVELGRSDVKGAQRTLAAVGRQRFLGTIIVPPQAPTTPSQPPPPNGAPNGPP